MKIKLSNGELIELVPPYSITMSQEEKAQIQGMAPHCTRICAVPDDWTDEQIEAFRGPKE